jgi:hypothetical protein
MTQQPTNNVNGQSVHFQDNDSAIGDDEYDNSDLETIPDYDFAWHCYRQYYLEEEREIRRLGYFFWFALTPEERLGLATDFDQAIDDTVKEFAPRRALIKLREDGWDDIIIAPEHLHISSLS